MKGRFEKAWSREVTKINCFSESFIDEVRTMGLERDLLSRAIMYPTKKCQVEQEWYLIYYVIRPNENLKKRIDESQDSELSFLFESKKYLLMLVYIKPDIIIPSALTMSAHFPYKRRGLAELLRESVSSEVDELEHSIRIDYNFAFFDEHLNPRTAAYAFRDLINATFDVLSEYMPELNNSITLSNKRR